MKNILFKNTHDYCYESAYQDYLNNNINNEQEFKSFIAKQQILSENALDKYNKIALLEADINIKDKNNKFVEFIESLIQKFLDAINNISQKNFLEKYKDIIINKEPKIKGRFDFNVTEAKERIKKHQLQVFNEDEHAKYFENKDTMEKDLAIGLINDSEFKYDDGASLADNLKQYFYAMDKPVTNKEEKEFTNQDLKDMYDYCYNKKELENYVKKDVDIIKLSASKIESYIESNKSKDQNNNSTQPNNNQNESALLEADDQNDNNNQQNNNDKNTPKTPSGPSVSAVEDNNDDNKKELTDEEAKKYGVEKKNKNSELSKNTATWNKVCQTIIAAKITVIEKISSDYMKVMKSHLQSYGIKVDTEQDKDRENNNQNNNNNEQNK